MKKLFAVVLLLLVGAAYCAAENPADGWKVVEENNQMDGDRMVTLSSYAQEEAERKNGVVISINCRKHSSRLIFTTDTVLYSTGNGVPVRIKFDDGKPQKKDWLRATSLSAAFAFPNITKVLSGAKVFVVEYTPYREGPRTVSFAVGGLKEKLEQYADVCGYKP